MFQNFFFLGDDPARLEPFHQRVAELTASLRGDDPIDRFDLEQPGQAARALLAIQTPPLLGDRRVVVWRNMQVLRSDRTLLALIQDALRSGGWADTLDLRSSRRSPLVQIIGEGALPAPKKPSSRGDGPPQPQQSFGFPGPIEQLLRGAEVATFFLPSSFDQPAQLQAVLTAAEAHGLRMTREQAGQVLLRLGPNSPRLRPSMVALAAAAAGGPITTALLASVVAGTHADPKALFQALLRRDVAQVMQLARQLEASGESGVAVLRRLQALAWEAVVLKLGASSDTTVLGEALGISSGAAYYRRQEVAAVPRARVESLLEAITALAAEQVRPAGRALPLGLQLQSLLA